MRNGNRFVGPAIALITGAAALFIHREPARLVEPHACTGVLEWIAATIARHTVDAPVGSWLLAADRALIVIAIAAFVSAAYVITRMWVPAIAAGLAFGAQPLLSPAFTPFGPVVAIVAAVLARSPRTSVVLIAVAAGILINPPTSSCWIPNASAPLLTSLRDAGIDWLTVPTMFALAIAALGAFSRLRRRPPVVFLAYVAAMFVTASVDSRNLDRALLPVSVALWLLVAVGLSELIANARRLVPRVAVLALVLLVPVLQVPRLRASTDGAAHPVGHEALTPRGMHHLIEVLPERAALVTEDALVDLLLRAEDRSWVRMGKIVTIVPRATQAVMQAIRDSPTVLSFPRAQLELQSQGFRLTDRAIADVSGLAEVALVAPCAPIPRGWQALPTLNASRVVSIVAERDRDRGPMVLYFAVDAPPQPVPQGWSEGVLQGYAVSTFQVGPDAARLDEALKDDALSIADFAAARYVVRFEIRRVAGAPRILSIDLGETPSVAYAKKWREAAEHQLLLCPAFPHTPAPIVIR